MTFRRAIDYTDPHYIIQYTILSITKRVIIYLLKKYVNRALCPFVYIGLNCEVAPESQGSRNVAASVRRLSLPHTLRNILS